MEYLKFILYHFAQTMMHLEIGFICFGISAFLRKNNVGLGIGIAILLYFLNIFANISEKAEFLKYITPFHYSDAAEIFPKEQIDMKSLFFGFAIGFLFLLIGFAKYLRKDIIA